MRSAVVANGKLLAITETAKPVIRQMFLLLAFILSVPVSATDDIPHILLTGTGENEIAPHGEGNIYAPSVLIDGGKWTMWYGGQGKDGHDRISYAESTDGKQWNRIGVVLEDKTANGDTLLFFGAARAATWDHNCIAVLPLHFEGLKQ
ncbi:MAG: hypothetical protein KDB01_01180 [Planctomycetaceae bacterium]|nr:hypothetical protein [Planctomycetaceae bacterium]